MSALLRGRLAVSAAMRAAHRPAGFAALTQRVAVPALAAHSLRFPASTARYNSSIAAAAEVASPVVSAAAQVADSVAAAAQPVAAAAAAAIDASVNVASVEMATSAVHAYGGLKAAGLASNWTPVGWVQTALEFMHVSTGLPWWGSIAVVTIGLRLVLSPVMIKLQRNAAVMANIKPELDRITSEMQKAKATHDTMKVQLAAQQAQELFAKNNVNPLKALAMPMIQAPIMFSFFLAIRGIAEAGIPSFKEGGFGWILDLGVADPYYVLPVVASAGFLTVLEMNAETGVSNAQADSMRSALRFLGLAMIPLTASMPAGVFIYWTTSNMFTVAQAIALKNPAVRERFGIPQLVKHEPVDPSGVPKKMGFVEAFRTSFNAGREAHEKMMAEQKKAAADAAAAGMTAKPVARK
ncbi:hypothetical protein H9P43_001957 [Blastocladiella emersonii ATCC 22665]|nr:hypothetical protein H9P43_001957 [Blastocladiella emersonii ATCC 22665]